MFRRSNVYMLQKYSIVFQLRRQSFLAQDYKCDTAWKEQKSSSIKNINLNDFFTTVNQNFTSKGIISAIDVDIFANAIRDHTFIEELKDLLHKLRMSAETGNTLESTHHATIRNYLEFGNIQDLVQILRDPLNFGIFLDDFTANILLDKLVTSNNFELAANVAALIMLQEEFSNEITCALSQYACYKYLKDYSDIPQETSEPEESKKKEEIKIRIKFLRNFYFDDHFDIKELSLLSGKTLAWVSRQHSDNVSNNLQIIGWMYYKKYDKLLTLCDNLKKTKSFKVYKEVIELIEKQSERIEEEKPLVETCITVLNGCPKATVSLEESIKKLIEDAINKRQKDDILKQQEVFKTWVKTREIKLKEQIERLDRAHRMKEVEDKQEELKVEEQKLWFFENEEQIDLEIENKEKLIDPSTKKKTEQKTSDENYIPPEILPKRK